MEVCSKMLSRVGRQCRELYQNQNVAELRYNKKLTTPFIHQGQRNSPKECPHSTAYTCFETFPSPNPFITPAPSLHTFLNQTLRVQVLNNHILAQNLYYNDYYPKPKYPIIGYRDPLGKGSFFSLEWR